MRNVVDKICEENQTHVLDSVTVFRKVCRLWDNVEIYCRVGQAIDDNTAQAHCMLDNYVYEYTIRICNIIAIPLQELLH
jgi:hypothetical protein